MESVFLKLVNMSITASYFVLAVIAFRLVLKKAPKYIRCILWGLVALRLVFPFSFESVLSLIPNEEPLSEEFLYAATPQINTGIPAVNHAINPVIAESLAPAELTSANPTQIWSFIFSRIWVIGMAVMALYAIISYLRLRRKVSAFIPVGKQLRLCDHISSPFILGIIRPKIYLPSDISQETADHVLSHEMAHLVRKDHWWKPLGYLLLTVYWFNPLIWVAYILLCRDIELACDERVVKNLDVEEKKAYSSALLQCSVSRQMIAACPLAFGEVGVKSRIKSVLNYKKPAFWVIVVAVVASIIVGVCFLTDPKEDTEPIADGSYDIGTLVGQNIALSYRPEEGDGQILLSDNGLTVTADDGTVLYTGSNPTFTSSSWSEVSSQLTQKKQLTLFVSFISVLEDDVSMDVYEFFEDGEPRYTIYCTQGKPSMIYDSHRLFVLEAFDPSNRLAPGTYIPVECLYVNPASSYYPGNLSEDYTYIVTESGFYTDSFAFICNTNVDNVNWGWKAMRESAQDLEFLIDWLKDDMASINQVELPISQDTLYQKLDSNTHLLRTNGDLFIIHGSEARNDIEAVWGIYRLEAADNIYFSSDNGIKMEITDAVFCQNAVIISAEVTFPDDIPAIKNLQELSPGTSLLYCGEDTVPVKASSIEAKTDTDASNSIRYRFLFDTTGSEYTSNHFLLNVGEFRYSYDSDIVAEDVFTVSWNVSSVEKAKTFTAQDGSTILQASISDVYIRLDAYYSEYTTDMEVYQALKLLDRDGNELLIPFPPDSGSYGSNHIRVSISPRTPWDAANIETVMIGDYTLEVSE